MANSDATFMHSIYRYLDQWDLRSLETLRALSTALAALRTLRPRTVRSALN